MARDTGLKHTHRLRKIHEYAQMLRRVVDLVGEM